MRWSIKAKYTQFNLWVATRRIAYWFYNKWYFFSKYTFDYNKNSICTEAPFSFGWKLDTGDGILFKKVFFLLTRKCIEM